MSVRPQLGEFLQTRRARVRPDEVGLATGHDRRVSGLRREEVALLANVSVDYYVRLEQGRARHPSPAVLGAVADALRLTPAEREHLLSLADPPARARPAPAVVRPALDTLIQSMRDIPAVVLDRLTNVLAWNSAAAALITDFTALDADERNVTRLYFLDPAAPAFYEDWTTVAKDAVAQLRRASAEYADDPELAELVEELTTRSPLFAQWWRGQDVRTRSHCPKVFNHPAMGHVTFTLESLDLPGDDGQYVLTFTPADPATELALHALLSTHTPA
ncbi:helix-turn-helix protein [Kribbella sp. VKM Ac-2527]|uniref:Helix-turn-helix protein n=1 Tax=Kribbella caucasensis TaxID=2512215 RepID=A0A4V3C713_9ACTN|nr:helix-turn-helix transcriptional regulator [Kribbella sp. VKM Ac-2527]TDO35838.1 helix-turn-helix protein [Kribbella sp. VKM Ac-2527]